MKDDELVKGLHRGDTEALEALIACYTPYVSAVIARILKDHREDWEELTADVFFSIWENRAKLRADCLRGYLGKIARNRAFNFLRTRRDVLPLEDDILVLEEDSPEKMLESEELALILGRALARLGSNQRELFVRHYYYGQTVAEAAANMGVNPSTAKTWLRRGREILKTYLEKEGCEYEAGNF